MIKIGRDPFFSFSQAGTLVQPLWFGSLGWVLFLGIIQWLIFSKTPSAAGNLSNGQFFEMVLVEGWLVDAFFALL
ncbi:MAG: hypothetical protein ACKVH8_17990 [Pirellulales bacterium]